MTPARLVPVKLADLRYGDEFVTALTRRRGVVSRTGWCPWDDGTGRTTRIRSVAVRYADGAEVIHRAGMLVLVKADTPHARFSEAEERHRWKDQLRDPDAVGTLGELAHVKPQGLPC